MAKKEITSRPGLFGTTNHYDSRGKKIEKDTDRDNFLDPEEAVAYGLIDKVITSR